MSQGHEEEMSTQTQVGKPRRTNSSRFNADEEGKRRATLLKESTLLGRGANKLKFRLTQKANQ